LTEGPLDLKMWPPRPKIVQLADRLQPHLLDHSPQPRARGCYLNKCTLCLTRHSGLALSAAVDPAFPAPPTPPPQSCRRRLHCCSGWSRLSLCPPTPWPTSSLVSLPPRASGHTPSLPSVGHPDRLGPRRVRSTSVCPSTAPPPWLWVPVNHRCLIPLGHPEISVHLPPPVSHPLLNTPPVPQCACALGFPAGPDSFWHPRLHVPKDSIMTLVPAGDNLRRYGVCCRQCVVQHSQHSNPMAVCLV
jgi:hypothetical protein